MMDVLVMLEERPEHSTVLAHVNSVPSPLNSERPSRDVVTLYGDPTAELLALALAAAVEARREPTERSETIRHVALWPERGAVGDAAWRDEMTGGLVTRDLVIPSDVLSETAAHLLEECGPSIRRLVAGLSMPDWPEGTRRAISFTLTSSAVMVAGGARYDAFLDSYRSADGIGVDTEGD
ncbi:MAG: hypothetical protein H7066_14530 [Cytophagaceae bacterium]|nr:hypothetical protein [Gemmatimonadaceae bacterium]